MGFTINQVRHLYVAKETKDGTSLLATDAAGSILPKVSKDGTLMFQYMSPAGIIGSDKINLKSLIYAKATSSDALAYKLKLQKVVLDSAVSDAPVAGQEYILRVTFKNYISMSDEDLCFKYGFAKATPGMTASDLYKAIALSLVMNITRDTTPLAKVYLDDTEVTPTTKAADLTGTYTCIKVEQVEQDWKLGRMPQAFIDFEVNATDITVEGEQYIWGTVTTETPVNVVENGKKIAELEYFCMGARGDMYRGMAYPHNIDTTYLVDTAKKYDTLDIHYAFVGANEEVQKSERDITIVCENDGSHTLMNDLIAKINTATGLEIATLE